MNFGAFSTPEDNILFDVNDFDETIPNVDFTVDLKRLAASVAVAATAMAKPKTALVLWRGDRSGVSKACVRSTRSVAVGNLAQSNRSRTATEIDW
jgi:hypothetical protein